MSATFTFYTNEKTGNIVAHIHLSSDKTSTFYSERIRLNKTTTTIQAQIISEEQDTLSEKEWHSIIKKQNVQNALRRLAAEARRQIAAEETEEGGFAIE